MTTVANKIKNLNVYQCIDGFIDNKFPFAIYRLPHTQNIHFLGSLDRNENRQKIDFEEIGSGFAIAPFEDRLPFFIKSDIFGQINNTTIQLNYNLDFINESAKIPEQSFGLKIIDNDIDEKKQYLKKIEEVIAQIKSGFTQKVVISRKKHLGHLTGTNYFEGFSNLCKNYPSAMISLVYLPWLNQFWMGATPEILVSQNQNGIFKTVALAGTQSATDNLGNEIAPIDALWSHKEIEEQALVSRYIINCLKKIRVREFEEYGPKTIKAGNLLHLNTSFLINTNDINFPNLSSVMLELLHPTSAVCGLPKDTSLKIIKQFEEHNREMYSGYLGPVNIFNESHLFVNLRTMLIQNSEVYAFAGGGITEDSVPEKEWNETEIKLKTIQKSFDIN